MVRKKNDEILKEWIRKEAVARSAPTTDPNEVRRDPSPMFVHASHSLRSRTMHTRQKFSNSLSDVSPRVDKAFRKINGKQHSSRSVSNISAADYADSDEFCGVYLGKILMPLVSMHRHIDDSIEHPPRISELYTRRADYSSLKPGTVINPPEPIDNDTKERDLNLEMGVYCVSPAEFARLLCSKHWTHRERIPSSSTARPSGGTRENGVPNSRNLRSASKCIVDTIFSPGRYASVLLFRAGAPFRGAGDIIATDPTTVSYTWAFEYAANELDHFRRINAPQKWLKAVVVTTMLKRLTKAKKEGFLLAADTPSRRKTAMKETHIYAARLGDVVAVNPKGDTSETTGSREAGKKSNTPDPSSRGNTSDQPRALPDGVSMLGKRPASTLPAPDFPPRSSKSIRIPSVAPHTSHGYHSSDDDTGNWTSDDSGDDTSSDSDDDDGGYDFSSVTEQYRVIASGVSRGVSTATRSSVMDGTVPSPEESSADFGSSQHVTEPSIMYAGAICSDSAFEDALAKTLSSSMDGFPQEERSTDLGMDQGGVSNYEMFVSTQPDLAPLSTETIPGEEHRVASPTATTVAHATFPFLQASHPGIIDESEVHTPAQQSRSVQQEEASSSCGNFQRFNLVHTFQDRFNPGLRLYRRGRVEHAAARVQVERALCMAASVVKTMRPG